jgi:long-chain acyl-CoA synthetase
MNCRNLADVHQWQAEHLGRRPALRFKRYGLWHDLSWERYAADARACAAALIDAGIQPGDRVGLLAENSMKWLIADMGILAAAAVNVPPHSPLTARQIHFQLAETEARWVFVSTREQLEKIRQIRGELSALDGVVVFDRGSAAADAIAWETFLQRGRQALEQVAAEQARRQAALGPEDLATIMYTSGTTGNPKGVMLTHGNLMSNSQACLEASPYDPDALLLSWLPYSHIYARTADHYLTLRAGITLALAENPEALVQNLAEVQPTHMTAVPRFYEKVLAAVASEDVKTTGLKLKRLFGARLDWLSSGGAPLSRPVAEAFHAAGLLLLQGYGLTESSPVITFNRKTRHKIGTVGLPVPGVEVQNAPDGEVLTRGPHVMKGYWQNPQATSEAIRDGWLYTGDLGTIDADGFLTITGRKKELLVLSNGKKLVPTHIEGLLAADDFIDQAVVCGEGRPFLTALIVPRWEAVRKALAAGTKTDQESLESLSRHPSVRELLRRRIDAALRDVSAWERVKSFVVVAQPFSVAADELTVSLKLRRNVILARHAEAIEALYQDGGALSREPAVY